VEKNMKPDTDLILLGAYILGLGFNLWMSERRIRRERRKADKADQMSFIRGLHAGKEAALTTLKRVGALSPDAELEFQIEFIDKKLEKKCDEEFLKSLKVKP
jgi:hypothetical protein